MVVAQSSTDSGLVSGSVEVEFELFFADGFVSEIEFTLASGFEVSGSGLFPGGSLLDGVGAEGRQEGERDEDEK